MVTLFINIFLYNAKIDEPYLVELLALLGLTSILFTDALQLSKHRRVTDEDVVRL